MSKKITTATPPVEMKKEQGCNTNTELCVNLKTKLYNDKVMVPGKRYRGVLKKDLMCEDYGYDEHFTFVETKAQPVRRNPRLFNGKFISITRQGDGSLRPNFKPMKTDKCFSVERYAFGVYRELYKALKGLVGEKL